MIVGWDITNVGADGGLMTPMVEQIERHFHQRPGEYLADGAGTFFVGVAMRKSEC